MKLILIVKKDKSSDLYKFNCNGDLNDLKIIRESITQKIKDIEKEIKNNDNN